MVSNLDNGIPLKSDLDITEVLKAVIHSLHADLVPVTLSDEVAAQSGLEQQCCVVSLLSDHVRPEAHS